MATSRTGTAQWFKVRDQRMAIALEQGMTTCPSCGVWLDWAHSRRPNSPEVDHVIPHSKGGQDVLENTQILCRRENQSKGGKDGNPKGVRKPRRIDFGVANRW